MKLLIMGTGPFAVPSFNALLDSPHQITGLVTRPDRIARGRKKAPPNPMRSAAEAAGIDVFAPDSINSDEGLQLLQQHAADLFVVCDYGQILSKAALELAKLGGINLHGSLLPRYRGAAPINWALLNGDQEAGITVIHMTPRLDGGPMLCRRSLEVGPTEDAVQLEQRLSQLGVPAVIEAIDMLQDWDGATQLGDLQAPADVTRAPRLAKSDGLIDWSIPADELFNRVRALQPWPGTYTNLLRPGKPPMRVIVKSAPAAVGANGQLTAGVSTGADGDTHVNLESGQAELRDEQLWVGCGTGCLRVDSLQPAGKRAMDATEFARGYGAKLQFGNDDT